MLTEYKKEGTYENITGHLTTPISKNLSEACEMIIKEKLYAMYI